MIFNHQERDTEGFPNGSVVKTLSANVGDMGSIPGPGRSHMLRDNEACMPQLSLCSRVCQPQLLSPCATAEAPTLYSLCSATGEATSVRSPCTATLQLESSPA